MGLKDELTARLDQAAPAGPHKARNIGMVLHYYGFSDAPWPTLDESAKAFGLGGRERARQILNETFRERISAERLPRLRAAARLLRSRPIWISHEFAARIADCALVSVCPSTPGLLRLMHDLRLAARFEIYDATGERLVRAQYAAERPHLIVRGDASSQLKATINEARRRSTQLGLVNTERLEALASEQITSATLRAVLRITPDGWTSCEEDHFWYASECRDNVLVSLSAKVFSVVARLPIAHLAAALSNALRGRKTRSALPPRTVIEAWIRGSRYFSIEAEYVTFLGVTAALTDVETALVNYLSARSGAGYGALKAHLRSCGVGESVIPKIATLSPLVQVDRRGGLRAHTYSLVGRG